MENAEMIGHMQRERSLEVRGGSNCGVTEVVLEDIAGSIDFALLKNMQAPEMRGDAVP